MNTELLFSHMVNLTKKQAAFDKPIKYVATFRVKETGYLAVELPPMTWEELEGPGCYRGLKDSGKYTVELTRTQ